MSVVVLVVDSPTSGVETSRLEQLDKKLGELPSGVRHPATNVWLVDTEVALDFLLSFPERAASVGQTFRGYNTTTAPKPPFK